MRVAVTSRPWRWLLLLAALPAFAQSVSSTQTDLSQTARSEEAASPLSTIDLARWRAWGLTEIEWRRYRTLLQGIRGSISPANLSPIEVLGIHARDDAERRRYAELWARAMFEDAERILAFQRAYDAAVQRLYPELTLISKSHLHRDGPREAHLASEDRVLFFTRLECPACDRVFGELLKHLDHIEGIDVYVTGVAPSDDAAIRQWAASHTVQADWVRAGRVTLNHDAGALRRIADESVEVPALFARRADRIRPISYASL